MKPVVVHIIMMAAEDMYGDVAFIYNLSRIVIRDPLHKPLYIQVPSPSQRNFFHKIGFPINCMLSQNKVSPPASWGVNASIHEWRNTHVYVKCVMLA